MKLKMLFRFLLSIAVIVFSGFFFLSNQSYIGLISSADKTNLFFVFFFSGLIYFGNSLLLMRLLKPFGLTLNFQNSLSITVLSRIGNLISPFRAGDAVRGLYLKRKVKLPYSSFLSTLIATYVLTVFVVALLGLFAFVYSQTPSEPNYYNILAILIFFLIFSGFFMVYTPPLPFEIIKKLWCGWDIIRKSGIIPSLLTILSFNILCASFAVYFAFNSIGYPISPASSLILATINSFSHIITLTPGNIGAQEVVLTYVSGLLGSSNDVGMSVSLIIRASELASLISLFILQLLFRKDE